jgi:DNA-binding transcriptional ArsR family regulator
MAAGSAAAHRLWIHDREEIRWVISRRRQSSVASRQSPVGIAVTSRQSAVTAARKSRSRSLADRRSTLALDRLIHERLRLGIISALAVNERLTFNDLKRLLQTTDGNLSVHARKLEDAQYITCDKMSRTHAAHRIPADRRRPPRSKSTSATWKRSSKPYEIDATPALPTHRPPALPAPQPTCRTCLPDHLSGSRVLFGAVAEAWVVQLCPICVS